MQQPGALNAAAMGTAALCCFPNLCLSVEDLSAESLLRDFGVRLRPATAQDGEACFALIADTIIEFGLAGRPVVKEWNHGNQQQPKKKRKSGNPRKKLRRGLKDVIDPATHYPKDDERRCLEVVEHVQTGDVVGTVGFSALARDRSVFELKRLYLRLDQRGQGLGKRLFERRLRAIARLNPSKVVTTVAAPLAANLHLHASHGFAVRDGVTRGYNQGECLCTWTREGTEGAGSAAGSSSIDSAPSGMQQQQKIQEPEQEQQKQKQPPQEEGGAPIGKSGGGNMNSAQCT